jgi:hypothetical protein
MYSFNNNTSFPSVNLELNQIITIVGVCQFFCWTSPFILYDAMNPFAVCASKGWFFDGKIICYVGIAIVILFILCLCCCAFFGFIYLVIKKFQHLNEVHRQQKDAIHKV